MTPADDSRPEPVRATLVADLVHRRLEEQILTGALPGGARLRVRQLAEEVGTSVMPVREAIRRLQDGGLVVHEPHRGAVVKEFSASELLDAYEIRALLEPHAARLGCEAITPADLDRMRERQAELLVALDEGRFVDALDRSSELMLTLYRAGANAQLVDMIDLLWKRTNLYRRTVAQRTGRLALGGRDSAIIDAVAARDGERVAAETESAIRDSRQALLAMHSGHDDRPGA